MTEPFDAGDAMQVGERREKLKIKERGDGDQFKALMEQKAFRAFVWRLLAEAQVFQPIMTGNSYTFMNEGKRQMGLWVLEQINRICPDLYVVMAKEAAAREMAVNKQERN